MHEKIKSKDDWFIGTITGQDKRESLVNVDFLDQNKKYIAINYAIGEEADWRTNPEFYQIRSVSVNSKSKLKQILASDGGASFI